MALYNEKYFIEIDTAQIFSLASGQAITELVVTEIHKQITEDADMRILVRQLVAESISKMNLAEVVTQAVALALRDQKAIEPLAETFTCPMCQRTSRHPEDVKHRYCGACHMFA